MDSIKHGSYRSRRGQDNDYTRALKEADPGFKAEEKEESIFNVDEEPEVEKQSFMDKVQSVWDAYMED
jgi:hypothetical protein